MATDPNIIFQLGRGVTPLLSPADIQNQQLQRETGAFQLNALRQSAKDDAAYRDVLRTNTPEMIPNKLYQAGLGKQGQDWQKFQSDQQKTQMDTQKSKLEAGIKQFEAIGQIMSGVRDQATYDMARQQVAGIVGPEAMANIPAVYDPATVARNQQQAMSVKDRMEQERKRYEFDNPSANTILQAQTSQANNAATIANSRRTADMTDARTREFNATKVEENTLKREAKQDTADMTRAGQVASFDTMLGTLDRLSKHPGLERSVGLTGKLPTLPGSDSANFQAELDTFQSQAFVPMVAQLKGMGALSDAEGRKLTQAVGALNPNMGEKAFRESIARITADMNAARARVVGNKPAAPKAGGIAGSTRTVTIDGNQLQARRAPDGKFYVQQNGKYFEVKE
ncbi:hypothetical protein D9M72_303720 [compost metagenome]